MLSRTVKNDKQEFDKVFLEIDHFEKLTVGNKNDLKFFMLDIQNNKYCYYNMFSILKGNLGRYALSRKEFDRDPEMAISKAISRFHEVKNAGKGAGGELGEILLYLFLETVLGAPKLLSKMELKGTRNQYNYNSDAVHFYSFKTESGQHNQIILCESKLIGDYKSAIKKAFDSLKTSLTNKDYDFSLVSTEIFKETLSEEDADRIINQILPNVTEDYKNHTIKETAAGIFIGYNQPIEAKDDTIKTREENLIKIKNDIPEIAKLINDEIQAADLTGMSFYIYFLPFNKVDDDRAKIMEQLLINSEYKG